jgi:thiol-disulfide isomerase/thioredoxin
LYHSAGYLVRGSNAHREKEGWLKRTLWKSPGTGLLLLVGSTGLCAQQTPPVQAPPQNSNPQAAATPSAESPKQTPGEIYKAAMHPLDIVRSSLDNWSDAELGALTVGIKKAHDACEEAKPMDYAGDDVYDLARLCALGQDWGNANAAALAYIASKQETHQAQAYALSVNALVHMNAIDLALETTREMLRRSPYDAEVAYAVRYMKDDLEQASNPAALNLASEEHAAIVEALKKDAPLKAVSGDAVVSVGALCDSAMELAFWQRYGGDDAGAAATVADVDAALPQNTPVKNEDAARIAAVRLRYGLLGAWLPEVKVLRALESPTAKAVIDTHFASATVLVLFPDWCGGCRKMMKTLTEFAKVNKETPIHAYGLVFADDSVIPVQAAHEEIFKELRATATLVVPDTTAQMLGATDYPLGIVIDRMGKIRFIGALPGDAFNGGGYIEKVIERMVAVEEKSEAGRK